MQDLDLDLNLKPRIGEHTPAATPERWDRVAQVHRWERLSFIHWAYPPEVVAPLLPAGLHVDEFAGNAWIGVIPFQLRITVPGLPYVPWAGRFVETNVRTYVRTDDGTPGIWFLSLDAARLGAVVFARTLWSLPYMWAHMRLDVVDDTVVYESRRRWPRNRVATSRIAVRVGEPYEPEELSALDDFLTARWWLFSRYRDGIAATHADHAPWPLRHAEALELDDGLLLAAGLPAPRSEPVVHHADVVDVRLSPRVAV